MKRKWVIGGSVGAGVLLVMAMLSTVVCAQTTRTSIKEMMSDIQSKKTIDEKTQTIQNLIKSETKENGTPGGFLGALIGIVVMLISYLIGFWFLLPAKIVAFVALVFFEAFNGPQLLTSLWCHSQEYQSLLP